jgi:hypothetical protein
MREEDQRRGHVKMRLEIGRERGRGKDIDLKIDDMRLIDVIEMGVSVVEMYINQPMQMRTMSHG